MWCEPFLSPPKMCRFFAKQMVIWATFQSIGLQDCKKPVSSPTFGASSLNQWKLGPTCEQHFVQFPENPGTQMRGEDTMGLEQAILIYMLKGFRGEWQELQFLSNCTFCKKVFLQWECIRALKAFKARMHSHCKMLLKPECIPIAKCF